MARKNVAYDENAIQTLDALEHIRLRTGMYIGRVGDGTHPSDGIYILMKEIIDNAVDEFIMGQGKKIVVERKEVSGTSMIRMSRGKAEVSLSTSGVLVTLVV